MRLLLIVNLFISTSVYAYTQQSFVEQLLSTHEFFEKEMINLKIKKLEMEGDQANYGNWSWDIGAEIGHIHKDKQKYDYTSGTDYSRDTHQQVRKISSDLSKKFFSNGSELTLSFDRSLPVKGEQMHDKNGYQKDKNTTEYLTDTSISWTLPLLKNKAGIVDQKTYDLAVLDYEDEKLILKESQEDFIEDKVFEFIDWVGFKWQIDTVNKAVNKLESIRQKMAIDQLTDAKVLVRFIDKKKRLLLSLQSKLKAQTGLLLASDQSIDFLKDMPELPAIFYVDLVDDIERYCRSNIRDLQRIDLELQKNGRYIKTYQNAQLADFDFTISAAKDNNKGNYTSYSKSSETNVEAKLVFSYPLSGDISNQVYLDKYRFKRRQIELKYENKLKDVVSAIYKLDTDIKQGLIQLKLAEQQIQQNKINNELNLYYAGQGDVRFAIIEQEDYQQIQLEKNEILIELYKNKLKYNSLLDRLLPHS
ncbi:MAG: TolC family protein [Proteobacteria bacterium]|nr:TolC family protein [Pseudomonadota bacterium]